MSKIALIGSKGYIGKHFEWFLREHNYHVCVIRSTNWKTNIINLILIKP